MARLTDNQRELILADFHTGQYTLRDLGFKYKTSHVTIGKLVKGIEPKHTEKVNTISTMTAELHQESLQEVNAVTKEIDKRTKHILLFETSALKNQKKANDLLDGMDKIHEIEAHARTTQKNKETVLGKDKTVELNNTNAQQNNTVEVIEIEYHKPTT